MPDLAKSLFLSPDDLAVLTGRKSRKKQTEELRKMAIPFWVNALGIPVVPVSAVTGQDKSGMVSVPEKWSPACV